MSKKPSDENKNDWALKVLAVVFAIMLWFYADAEQNPTIGKQFDVPIEYIHQADDMIVAGNQQSIRITVRGKEMDLSGLRGDDFEAYVDLSGAREGKHEYDVIVRAANVSEKFSYTPNKITLEIERVEKKEVAIRVKTIGTLPDGFELEKTEALPDKVLIAGRKEDLKRITEIETEPIDIRHMKASITKSVSLKAIEDVHIMGDQQITVAFTVSTGESSDTHEAAISLVHVGNGLHAQINQPSATVHISGSGALIGNKNERNKIQLYVDCSGLGPGQYELPVKVNYRGELTIGQIQPHTVVITIENTDNPNPEEPENGSEENGNHEGEEN